MHWLGTQLAQNKIKDRQSKPRDTHAHNNMFNIESTAHEQTGPTAIDPLPNSTNDTTQK